MLVLNIILEYMTTAWTGEGFGHLTFLNIRLQMTTLMQTLLKIDYKCKISETDYYVGNITYT